MVDRELASLSPVRGNKRTVMGVVVAIIASILAFASTVILIQSTETAIALNVLFLGIVLIWFLPFLGLLNYLVFLYLRPQEFIGDFQGLPVILIVGGVTLAVTLLFSAIRKRWPFKAAQDALILWLFVALVVSQLATFYLGGVVDTIRQYGSQVVTYMLLVSLVASTRKLGFTLYTLLILTLFQAIQGIFQFFTGANFAGTELIAGRIQGIGIFADPNNLAMTFLMVLPFAVLRTLKSRSMLFRIIMIAVIAVLVYGVFLTDSRGGFLGLGAIVFTMVSRRIGYKKGAAVALVVFALLFLAGPSRMRQFDSREQSAYGRVEAWSEGIDMFQSRPLFGVGARNFLDHHFLAAHNSFIECAAELGLFGLIPWVALLMVGLRSTSYVGSHATEDRFGALGLYAEAIFHGLVGFVVTATFIARAYSDMFFLIIGLTAVASRLYVLQSDTRIQVFGRRDLFVAIASTFVLLLVFKIYVMLYW